MLFKYLKVVMQINFGEFLKNSLQFPISLAEYLLVINFLIVLFLKFITKRVFIDETHLLFVIMLCAKLTLSLSIKFYHLVTEFFRIISSSNVQFSFFVFLLITLGLQ